MDLDGRIRRLDDARRALTPGYEKAPDQKRTLAMVERQLRAWRREQRRRNQTGSDTAS